MTVADLIDLLKTQPQDAIVAYNLYSDLSVMEPSQITLETHCVARNDRWVQRARPDKPSQLYLVFPGN